jgi:PAS domain S-box-containing protein
MGEQSSRTGDTRSAPGPRGGLATYALAFGALAAAVGLRYALDPWIGDALPLVTLFGAIAAAVWVGGYRPAIVSAVAGYVACDVLFIPPRGQLTFAEPGSVIGALAYLFTCALIIAFGEAMRVAQQRSGERREVLRVTLRSIGDAVITTDVEGRITTMNAVAESLTGWTQAEAAGQPLDDVFRIVNEETRQRVESPAAQALRKGTIVGLANHTLLLGRSGGEYPIDDSAAPIRDEDGNVSGCVLIFRDVTAQRRSDRDRASQLLTARLLASIIESSDDAIISKSLDGTIQTWNAAAERLFGYPADQAVGRHISLVIPRERLSEEDHIIASLRAGRRIEHFETERVRSDGARIIVSLTISPIRDAAGEVVGASKIVRDVTRQRQAAEREHELLAEAAAANAKFQAFFEQGALLATIMDVRGTVLEANRTAWEGCGYAREQVVGRPFRAGPWWGLPGLAEQIEAGVGQAAAGQTFRAEMRYVVADGSVRMADVTIQPITDGPGRVLFLAATGADVTERTQAESERRKFVTLVENSTDFIGICDLDGVPFFVNRAGLALVGLESVEEARRMPVASFFFPEDQQKIVAEFLPMVLANGHGEIEVRFRHFKTGAARWMAYKVLTLPDADGRPIAFATVSQDVTERKRLEDDLRHVAADLSEADRRKNEFLAMLAHELRNPLAPISNATEALRRAGGDAQAVRLASEMLERQVGQMSRLVDDLLDMSRITRGKIELRKGRVEIAPIVEHAVEAVRALYRTMNRELAVSMPTEPIALDADAARLTQVIGNLLSNACKFTDPGGHVWLTVERQGEHVVIRVRDDGIGMAEEHLSRIFDMFAQVDTSLERSRGGLGIGLTLVKTLVDMHGGAVTASSGGLGQGSEFSVRLPVAPSAPERLASDATADPVQPAGRRVLIVDDSLDGAESLSILLQYSGHETHMAHDGIAALEAAERLRPDAVLLDIGLPRLNGYEVCKRIRQQPWGRAMTLVALTGWGQDEDRHRSREAGFDAHMVKPVDHEALATLLAAAPHHAHEATRGAESGHDRA